MSKKKQIIALAIVIVIILSTTAIVVSGYDSASDPLVSLSYITDVLKPEIKGEISKSVNGVSSEVTSLKNEVSDLKKEIEGLKSQISDLSKQVNDLNEDVLNAQYQILELHQGDVVYVTTSADVVLRSGSAVVISPFDSQGLNDYSVGTELFDGDRVIINHYLLIPRGNDGRGVKVTSDVAYLMVRGGVNVVKSK